MDWTIEQVEDNIVNGLHSGRTRSMLRELATMKRSFPAGWRAELADIAADNHHSALTLGVNGLRGQCIETSVRVRALLATNVDDR